MRSSRNRATSLDAVDFVERLVALQKIFGTSIEVAIVVSPNCIIIKGAGLPDEVEIHKPESPEFSNKLSYFPVSQSSEKATRDMRPNYYG